MVVKKEDVEKSANIIIEIHNHIIDVSGGEKGVRDIEGLHHAIYEILEIIDKTKEEPSFKIPAKIYLMFSTRHYFIDGNKRTAHVLAKLNLLDQGYIFKINYKTAVSFIISIAANNKSITEIEYWIKASCDKCNINEYINDFKDDIENFD